MHALTTRGALREFQRAELDTFLTYLADRRRFELFHEFVLRPTRAFFHEVPLF
jgi:hypothetical protein